MNKLSGRKQLSMGDRGRSSGTNRRGLKAIVILLIIAFLPCMTLSMADISRAYTGTASGWTWQNPLPQGNFLACVTAVDEDTAWAVGKYGTIIKTIDGTNWTLQNSGTDEYLTEIGAASANVAWAVGTNGLILKTTDGGVTWNPQNSGKTVTLTGISVVDANTIWISCGDETALKTTDGGDHWVEQVTGSSYNLADISAVDAQVAWVVGGLDTICKTLDGGQTWTKQTPPEDVGFFSVSAVDTNTAFIVGYFGGDMSATILRTTNGGDTWERWSNSLTRCFYSIAAVDAQTAWVAGGNGDSTYIMKTTNGTSWNSQVYKSGTDELLYGISAVSANVAWVVGEGGDIRKTTNGGTNWVSQVKGVTSRIQDISCFDTSTAWAVLGGGNIFKTTDKGNSWLQQTSGTSNGLTKVSALNANTVWTVGGNGTILKTTNGGTSWGSQTSGTSNDLYALAVVDANTAWVVGENGTIRKTTNGGTSWGSQTSGTSLTLRGVAAVDANTAWAAGGTGDMFGDGIILRTTNGGTNWTIQNSSVSSLEGIVALDADTAWAYGILGELVKTTDGGKTWAAQSVGPFRDIHDIALMDANTLWAVGDGIWKTFDGGNIWTTQGPVTDNSLFCIAAANNSVAWVGGAYGTILHTTNGGGGAGTTFYFAEGYTGTGQFDEWLCLMNPGASETTAHITYMFPDGTTQLQDVPVGATTRTTVKVNDQVGPDKNVSLKVEGDAPIVAERPMYFNYGGLWTGGHDVVGAAAAQRTFYFAEGTTWTGQFDEWLCLMNPGASETTAHVTYMFPDGTTQGQEVPVGATTRTTVKVNDVVGPDKDVSIMIQADAPIVAERPMYFNYGGLWTGGHDVVGISEPQASFYFAEGTTWTGQFDEWLCLMNPGASETTAHITYMFPDGTTQLQDVKIGPTTRSTVKVNDVVGPDKDVSIQIRADAPIVAERPMYFNYGGLWTGGHDVIGAPSPQTTFLFAEGYTGAGQFDEWLCLMNPGTSETTAHITYMFPDGTTQLQDVKIGPTTRSTVKVNDVVGPDKNVSIMIQADAPIVAERPMYFNYGGLWTGGHDVIGYTP